MLCHTIAKKIKLYKAELIKIIKPSCILWYPSLSGHLSN